MENNDQPMFKLKNVDKVNLKENATTSDTLADAENIKEFTAINNQAGSNRNKNKDISKTRKIYNFVLKNSLTICITVISAIIAAVIKVKLNIS
ncbi:MULTISPECIES: hypothetical protein [Enterobacter cloacae complex]|uniref:hypothetical protein n=1 Tax=Enterobacter cloacae complex TaxID=354276 RepID=UPI0005F0214C|nr:MULTISPECIES: hypothetical protein [Enterobacter cloacae complex]AVU51306.1 hypothetical protein AXJ76_15020 [Enterobacter cloacae]EHE7812864.1 hypothetical protein [Enterobacter hormaechei]EHF3578460.1 hypothetical protein [Enterobacter hormaechei]KJM65369.1 hypothetical protein SS16_23890 [Enterobacter hormaechei subsp. xiangfangensis]KJN71825.1 hypothetical protein SS48_22290 [Enterobacter hormaechei subsp. xiangfangensis]